MKKNKEASAAERWSNPVFVLNKLINGVIIILIILGVAFLALFVFGIRPYVVLSGSMEPSIKTGSLVFVNHKAKFSELKQGDVITYKAGEVVVTHRVHEVKDNMIVTKGDANDNADAGYVTASTLVGKDVYAVPHLGYAVQFLQTIPGVIASVAVIAVLVVGSLLTGRDDEEEK